MSEAVSEMVGWKEPDMRARGRYHVLETLSRTPERRVERVRDMWTGATAIRKHQDLGSSLREAKALLALPAGIAPRLLDLEWTGSALELVIEDLKGETLSREKPISTADAPGLVLAVCDVLAQVHRIGWVHADLKPAHILVARDRSVRLLDFGFALDLFGDVSEQTVGGTPPYLAPELRKGWMYDGRADLYSLGILLDEVCPNLKGDPQWAGVVERLTEEMPAGRDPDVVAFRTHLPRALRIPSKLRRLPRFGGPMRDRDALLSQLVTRIRKRPGSRLLVQARPGTGLSRFLREVVLAAAARRCGPVRIIDFGSADTVDRADSMHGSLSTPEARERTILLGLGDPSPGLHWVPESMRKAVLKICRTEAWERIDLPPIDVESMREIVATTLGGMDASSDDLARRLWEGSEGDLHAAAAGFQSIIESAGREEGLRWTVDPKKAGRRTSFARSVPPAVGDVPEALVPALVILARAGQGFPSRLGARLLREFHPGGTLAEIREHGYLVSDRPRRLRFVTKRLWQESFARIPDRTAEIDQAVCRSEPDPDRIDEVLHFSRLALQTGERERAGVWLGRALVSADVHRRYDHIVRLLSFLDPVPARWTIPLALRRIRRLHSVLGPSWSEERLARIAGNGLRVWDADLGRMLLERAASGRDPSEVLGALLVLAGRVAVLKTPLEFGRYRAAILRRARGRRVRAVLTSLDARVAFFAGRHGEARALASKASASLRGSAEPQEAMNLQLLAILDSAERPARAARMFKAAIAAAQDAEFRAQLRHNLTFMLSREGRLEEAAACANEGIREGGNRASAARRANLLIARAWIWADLDRVEAARREVRALFSSPVVRFDPQHLAPVRLLAAFCDLHQRGSSEAARQMGRVIETTDRATPGLQWDCRRFFVDAVLDSDASDLVADHRQSLLIAYDGDEPLPRSTAARSRALVLQQEGKLAHAREVLERELPIARTLTFHLARARYLHHVGLVLLAEEGRESVSEAARLFEDELGSLPKIGHGYYRVHALLSLGAALLHGNHKQALSSFSQAVILARRIHSPWLLKRSLEARLEALRKG